MSDENILVKIPGGILGSVCNTLPAAETVNETTQRMVLLLPDGKRAEVTFRKEAKQEGQNDTQRRDEVLGHGMSG
ncbi:MAG: hypothetical protein ABI612_12975 [Betaproteobacteria bacterium]